MAQTHAVESKAVDRIGSQAMKNDFLPGPSKGNSAFPRGMKK
jgi:hypothetical protein